MPRRPAALTREAVVEIVAELRARRPSTKKKLEHFRESNWEVAAPAVRQICKEISESRSADISPILRVKVNSFLALYGPRTSHMAKADQPMMSRLNVRFTADQMGDLVKAAGIAGVPVTNGVRDAAVAWARGVLENGQRAG